MPVAVAAALAAMVLAMSCAWAVQRITGNSGYIDAIWTFASGGVAALAVIAAHGNAARATAVAVVLGLWALRLGSHILVRSRTHGDDPRYAALMKEWGAQAPLRLFLFLQSQAIAGSVLVFSALAAAGPSAAFPGPADLVGIAIALGALVGEAVADRQLARCRALKTAICERGLWRWSRHPNYFFEFLFWCALPPVALSSGASWGAVPAFLAPAMMYWLLRHVSGVPPLEDHMGRTRGAAFQDYARRVSVFVPLPPRPASSATRSKP